MFMSCANANQSFLPPTALEPRLPLPFWFDLPNLDRLRVCSSIFPLFLSDSATGEIGSFHFHHLFFFISVFAFPFFLI